MTETRQIVVPGEVVGSTDEHSPGQNTYQEGRTIRALRLGVKSVRGDRISVISLNGRYEPARGDMVIGTIAELGPSNWYINIGAANDVGMHVNDVPWRVEFGETSKYLDIGDTVLLKIVHVDEMKKAQVSMKDRQCRKLTGGLIWEVSPSKVPRIVGRSGSMITLLKDYTSVRVFVGQNGVVWMDGEAADVALALEALQKIEAEAHTSGLTDRMKAWLEERRPGAADRKRAEREEVEAEEAEFRPAERRARPAVVREDEEEVDLDERPMRRERHERGERRGGREERGERRERGGREERGREERPERGERRDRGERHERGERPPRREEREERPARRFREEEGERPARRFRDEEPERPRRMRDELEVPRRREEREERPARRMRFEDEEEEAPRRPRFREEEGERPARRAEEPRPARRPRFEDDEEERPARRPERREEPRAPARKPSFDDEEEDEERPSRGEGESRRRRRGGRGRGRGGRKED